MEDPELPFDTKSLRLTRAIERAIVGLRLDSQGEFISIINALEMQFESGQPAPVVVALLADALLALAFARGVDPAAIRLPEKLLKLKRRVGLQTR